jgi:transcriptional regulator with XRE-family HTH domain
VAGSRRRKRADNPHAEGAFHLAGRLRQLRERARKTQEEVAAAAVAAGLSVATVPKIETGAVSEPDCFTVLAIAKFTVLAIAKAMGASIADLADLACSWTPPPGSWALVAWTGSWNGGPDNPSSARASRAMGPLSVQLQCLGRRSQGTDISRASGAQWYGGGYHAVFGPTENSTTS